MHDTYTEAILLRKISEKADSHGCNFYPVLLLHSTSVPSNSPAEESIGVGIIHQAQSRYSVRKGSTDCSIHSGVSEFDPVSRNDVCGASESLPRGVTVVLS